MFNLDLLLQDTELRRSLIYLLANDFRKLGCFAEERSITSLLEKISKASYEKVKYLPNRHISIYRTENIGYGYCNYYSIYRFREMIALGKIKKDIPIRLEYKHGNIFAYVNDQDLDIRCLLTNETYLFIHEETNEIWNTIIGKPTNPNRLYYRSDLDGIVSTIDRLATLEGLNAVYVEEKIEIDFI